MSNDQSVTTTDQNGIITRTIKVDRTRSNQEALKATLRIMYIVDRVVNDAPQGKDEEVEVVLFKSGPQTSRQNLDTEYDIRELNPADLQTISALNEADPSFADEHPNGTQWKDKNGNYCIISFKLYNGQRTAEMRNGGSGDWIGDWWFVGVRKISSQSSASLNS